MPFRSEKQRKYLHKNNPELARRWEKQYSSKPRPAKKPPAKGGRKG